MQNAILRSTYFFCIVTYGKRVFNVGAERMLRYAAQDLVKRMIFVSPNLDAQTN